MENVSFFTAVTYGNHPQPLCHAILEGVDSYFYLGGRKVQVIPDAMENGSQGVIWKAENASSIATALKIASYCTVVIPLIALIAKTILRSTHHFHCVEESALALIRQFWEQHIHSFSMRHGTSSLYLKHFKEHGISVTYPEALHDLVTKIRKVWRNHERDVMERTNYFRRFEERYDQAREDNRIAVSFTGDDFRVREYTTGERGYGGEWMRELRNFLYSARNKNAFSSEEQKVLDQAEALSEVLKIIPPMVVKIRGGSPAYRKCFGADCMCSLDALVGRVKRECPEWQNAKRLTDYLDSVVFPQVKEERNWRQNVYESTVNQAIPSEELDFEICGEMPKIPPDDYPKLDFDTPTPLSLKETLKLRIYQYPKGLSDREEFMDSTFEIEYPLGDPAHLIVTRRKCSSEETKAHALLFERKKLRQQWLRTFGFDERVA